MSDKKLLKELKEIIADTVREKKPNITFMGFLLANYSVECLCTCFPHVIELIKLNDTLYKDGGE